MFVSFSQRSSSVFRAPFRTESGCKFTARFYTGKTFQLFFHKIFNFLLFPEFSGTRPYYFPLLPRIFDPSEYIQKHLSHEANKMDTDIFKTKEFICEFSFNRNRYRASRFVILFNLNTDRRDRTRQNRLAEFRFHLSHNHSDAFLAIYYVFLTAKNYYI